MLIFRGVINCAIYILLHLLPLCNHFFSMVPPFRLPFSFTTDVSLPIQNFTMGGNAVKKKNNDWSNKIKPHRCNHIIFLLSLSQSWLLLWKLLYLYIHSKKHPPTHLHAPSSSPSCLMFLSFKTFKHFCKLHPFEAIFEISWVQLSGIQVETTHHYHLPWFNLCLRPLRTNWQRRWSWTTTHLFDIFWFQDHPAEKKKHRTIWSPKVQFNIVKTRSIKKKRRASTEKNNPKSLPGNFSKISAVFFQ